jgi:hypothetical protein
MVKRFGQIGGAELYQITPETDTHRGKAKQHARRKRIPTEGNEDIFTNKDIDPHPTFSGGGVSKTDLTATASAGEEQKPLAEEEENRYKAMQRQERIAKYAAKRKADEEERAGVADPPPVEEVEAPPVEEKEVDLSPGENKSRWTNANAPGWITKSQAEVV